MIWFAHGLDRMLSKTAPLPDEIDWFTDPPGDDPLRGGAPLHVAGMVTGSPDPDPAGTSPGWCRRLTKFLRARG